MLLYSIKTFKSDECVTLLHNRFTQSQKGGKT